MEYFNVKKYNDNLYQINDKLGVLSTLVIGSKKALVFDTCYGIGDLKEEIRKITDKELIVVNSHGHMDHSCGNYQFDEVYINEKDIELCKKHNGKERREANLKALGDRCVEGFKKDEYLEQGAGNLKPINIGDKIDLGDVELEVVSMEGHTAGSIGLYIKKWKLLLASDAACPFVWLFLDESLPLSNYLRMLEQVLKLDFDNFLVGHGALMYPKSKMQEFYDVASTVDMNKLIKVQFGNHEDANSYCYTTGKVYGAGDVGVIFDPSRMINTYYDQHMHSSFSADSKEDLENYVKIAKEKHIPYICTCEHFDYLTVVDGTTWIADYPKLMKLHEDLRIKYPSVGFLLGIELGYKRICFDEMVELSHKYPFDIIQLSIHDNNKWDYYFPNAFLGQEKSSMDEYFDLMLEAIERFTNFDVLSHIDFGFKTLKMMDKKWEFKLWDDKIRKVMKKVIELDKAFEINTKVQEVIYNIDKDNHHIEYILGLYKELGGKKVTLSSDAHTVDKYLNLFDKYMKILKSFGFNELSFFIKRKEYKYIIK